jgi:hypothetical protein
MADITMKVSGYRCERCQHEWVARGSLNAPRSKKGETARPKLCPKCKSAWWETPPPSPQKTLRGGKEGV